jgi:hypothetical protein
MGHLSVKEDDIDSINKHYEECKKAQEPFVICKRRKTKADVDFNHISFDKPVNNVLKGNHEEIVSKAIKIFQEHSSTSKGAKYNVGDCSITFRNLEVNQAEQAASEVFYMISKVANRSR